MGNQQQRQLGIFKKNLSVTRLLPWLIAIGSLAAAGTSLTIEALSGEHWPIALTASLGFMLFVSLIGIGYLSSARMLRMLEDRRQLVDRLQFAELSNAQAVKRLEAVFQIHKKFVETTNEVEIIDLALRSAVELSGARSAMYVPLDEHGQPTAAVPFGEQPYPIPEIWTEYLASPAVRERCSSCDREHPLSQTCPLMAGPFQGASGIFCLPLKRGDREFGVLNLHLPGADHFDEETQRFLRALADQTALAIEGHRLRRRELQTLHQLQAVRDGPDLPQQLSHLLENARQVLEADFALLYLPADSLPRHRIMDRRKEGFEVLISGEASEGVRKYVDGFIPGVLKSNEPVILGNLVGEVITRKRQAAASVVRTVMACPLASDTDQPLGVLVAGSHKPEYFNPRQTAVLQSVAGQAALAIQTANRIADVQYQAMMDERTRLAREIHDGLAQTLGFLKLQVSQTQSYMDRGDLERLQKSIRLIYQTLAEAYQEARFAIDGLRIAPEGNACEWLTQIVTEFNENASRDGSDDTGRLEARLQENSIKADIPTEVQAQLIRILQEALSNVRKHSEASQVMISFFQEGPDVVLLIQDNGRGFSAEEVPGPSRHGLRGMRERADLIGAEFQVISLPEEGTIVRISLPVRHEELEK